MRRVGTVLMVLGLGLATTPAPSAADPGHRRPRITVMRWKESPVTVTTGECDEQGVCDEETLILKAHDPDSSITEVEVWFDEDGDRAPFVYAHTFCVQGKKPGTPARLEIGVTFTEPGEYVVAAVAHSHERCLGHEEGDDHPALHSRVKRLETTVEEAEPV
jgi:hypothetical protein